MLMPLLGRWGPGHSFNIFVILAGLCGYTALTIMAFVKDAGNPHYHAAVAQAQRDAERTKQLATARRGIPTEGALTLLANDPLTQGPRLFASQCASCHTYAGHDGLGAPLTEPPTAPDLAGFGSREWLRGFMDPQQIETLKYFGGTAFVHPKEGARKSKMVRLITDKVPNYTPEQKAQLEKILSAVSAEAALPAQKETEAHDTAILEEGKKLFTDDALECADCHQFHNDANGDGPDLTGYGSHAWLSEFLKNPAHDRFYGKKNDRMPAFGKTSRLNARDLDLLIRWLRGETPN
jgi:ubiquinol-cytochrome c reductase cytochrome b subunit